MSKYAWSFASPEHRLLHFAGSGGPEAHGTWEAVQPQKEAAERSDVDPAEQAGKRQQRLQQDLDDIRRRGGETPEDPDSAGGPAGIGLAVGAEATATAIAGARVENRIDNRPVFINQNRVTVVQEGTRAAPETAPRLSEQEEMALLKRMEQQMGYEFTSRGITADVSDRPRSVMQQQVLATVESLKAKLAADFNRELESKGSRWRLLTGPVGRRFLMPYQADAALPLQSINPKQWNVINAQILQYQSGVSRGRNPESALMGINRTLDRSKVQTVHFESRPGFVIPFLVSSGSSPGGPDRVAAAR